MNSPFPFRIISHRGAKVERPENTLLAFDKALEYPIHGIELDIQWTKDGIPVVYHDPSLKKLQNSITSKDTISCLNWSEVQQLDVGNCFHKDFHGTRIPSLAEVLKRDNKRCVEWMFEIKVYDSKDYNKTYLLDFINLLQSKPPCLEQSKNIHILSFHKPTLEFLQEQKPDWYYIQNIDLQRTTITDFKMNELYIDKAHAFCGDIHFLNKNWVHLFRDLGGDIWTYTCNDKESVQKSIDLKVDAMMTDNPKWLFHSS